MATNNAQYQAAIYTFNGSGTTTVQSLTSNLSTAATAAATIDVQEVCKNNYLTCSSSNNDTDTDFQKAMTQINGNMPNPGTGTSGSTAQEVLFLVTDGVDDNNSGTCSQALSGTRCQEPMNTTWCTTIKNRGIRIALLYTEYLPMTSNSWYNTWIAPFQSKIEFEYPKLRIVGIVFQDHDRQRYLGGDAGLVPEGRRDGTTVAIRQRRSRTSNRAGFSGAVLLSPVGVFNVTAASPLLRDASEVALVTGRSDGIRETRWSRTLQAGAGSPDTERQDGMPEHQDSEIRN